MSSSDRALAEVIGSLADVEVVLEAMPNLPLRTGLWQHSLLLYRTKNTDVLDAGHAGLLKSLWGKLTEAQLLPEDFEAIARLLNKTAGVDINDKSACLLPKAARLCDVDLVQRPLCAQLGARRGALACCFSCPMIHNPANDFWKAAEARRRSLSHMWAPQQKDECQSGCPNDGKVCKELGSRCSERDPEAAARPRASEHESSIVSKIEWHGAALTRSCFTVLPGAEKLAKLMMAWDPCSEVPVPESKRQQLSFG